MKHIFSLTILLLSIWACNSSELSDNTTEYSETNYYTQGNNRTVAEWEPALGAMIVWPIAIPHKLVIELVKENHLFTLVEDENSRKEAEEWYTKWNIDLKKVTFIFAEQDVDAWWTRDWGPSAIFTSSGDYKLADGKYLYSTPATDMPCNDSLMFLFYDENNNVTLTQIEDDATIAIANQLSYQLLDLPFNNTGGNVMADGLGTAFSTCALIAENKYHGIDRDSFFQLNDSLMGFKNYHIISNFEKHGIQHIDCFLKLLDEETMLVAEPPSDHELFDVYNKIISEELSQLKTPYGRPYKIVRLKTARHSGEHLAAYTNSLILNKTVYVPLFNIPQDSVALKTWGEALPGYSIKGFEFSLDDEPFVTDELRKHYNNYGWNSGDALHCRTRAIWNPEMLFMSVNRIESELKAKQRTVVYVTIIDYSKKGLVENKSALYWRVSNSDKWEILPLSSTENPTHFFAEIPQQKSGTAVEYYVSAVSNSGERATRPVTASKSLYKFVTK